MSNKILLCIFNALHSLFIFIKIRKRNTVHFSLFIFMKELKNELLKNIKRFTIIVCTLFKNNFLLSPRVFSTVQWSRVHQESAVVITECYFYICFILIVNCDIKHISRSSHCAVFSLSRSKSYSFTFL